MGLFLLLLPVLCFLLRGRELSRRRWRALRSDNLTWPVTGSLGVGMSWRGPGGYELEQLVPGTGSRPSPVRFYFPYLLHSFLIGDKLLFVPSPRVLPWIACRVLFGGHVASRARKFFQPSEVADPSPLPELSVAFGPIA